MVMPLAAVGSFSSCTACDGLDLSSSQQQQQKVHTVDQQNAGAWFAAWHRALVAVPDASSHWTVSSCEVLQQGCMA